MYKSVVEGKGGIVARVVADSVSKNGKRITTFELEYHRFIHSELMTHRLFSRNAMSSRAVPITKMIDQVRNNPATPIHWGKNQAGMQATTEHSNDVLDNLGEPFSVQEWWCLAAEEAANSAEAMSEAGYHKQIVNRLLEPFQMMKTVLTATEFDNFFWLRCHKDAQPEIKELADCMYNAMQESEPEVLNQGEWHTPYVEHWRDPDGLLKYYIGDFEDPRPMRSETALKVSASCCAQVSYRDLDNSIQKALNIYAKLVESKPVHASPFEHQATPMELEGAWSDDYLQNYPDTGLYVEGHTHMARDGSYWSGNLCGWVQHRQLIEDNVCNKYDPS